MTNEEISRRAAMIARDADGLWSPEMKGPLCALVHEAVLDERKACLKVCEDMIAAQQKYGDACSGQKTDLDTDSKAFYYQLAKYDAAMLLRIEIQKRT